MSSVHLLLGSLDLFLAGQPSPALILLSFRVHCARAFAGSFFALFWSEVLGRRFTAPSAQLDSCWIFRHARSVP